MNLMRICSMKTFRNLLLASLALASLFACSDADEDTSINDVNGVIEDEFSEYRELIGSWEGGWYGLNMRLSADETCAISRGEPYRSRQGTWEYDADTRTITTTCGYIFNVGVCTPETLTCSDQYGEYHSFTNMSSIVDMDLAGWGDLETNRKVIIGTWKHNTIMTTLKFYKDGQFALFYGDTSYVGRYYWDTKKGYSWSLYIDCGLFEPDDMVFCVNEFSGMHLRLDHGYADQPTLAESMIVGEYTYVKN